MLQRDVQLWKVRPAQYQLQNLGQSVSDGGGVLFADVQQWHVPIGGLVVHSNGRHLLERSGLLFRPMHRRQRRFGRHLRSTAFGLELLQGRGWHGVQRLR